jgi:hypothetical protein
MFRDIWGMITGDLKCISQKYSFILSVLTLFFLIILLKLVFPLLSIENRFIYNKYYILISVVLLSAVSMVIGLIYGKLYLNQTCKGSDTFISVSRDSLSVRILTMLIFSFILIYLAILFINPVPAQGWLRTIYAAILFSFSAPFGFLFIAVTGNKRIAGLYLSAIYWILLIVLPAGLLLHHPWNYFAFFSPFYWAAWAWMVSSLKESLLFGTISVLITSVGSMLLLRYFAGRRPD